VGERVDREGISDWVVAPHAEVIGGVVGADLLNAMLAIRPDPVCSEELPDELKLGITTSSVRL